MNSPQIGLVIPIIQRRYIINLIKIIKETVIDFEIVICVVNDGNNKIKKYLCNQLPLDVELLNLEKNVCFAGANNAGWKFLLNKFPSIKYLGTINDDTIPQYKWLNYLVQSMEVYSTIGACAPVMITHTNHIFKRKEVFSSTWKLGGEKNPMFGKPGWNKGQSRSEETKKKISQSKKGNIPWNKGKKGLQVPWNKGLKMKDYNRETCVS